MADAQAQQQQQQATEGDYTALPRIQPGSTAFTHEPEHGFSLFLAHRTKTIHFVRHAEGTHNAANAAYGDETPTVFSTPGAWAHIDARLTAHGVAQCVAVRAATVDSARSAIRPQLVVVSPFSRTLQTAHILFGGQRVPFMVHDGCRERIGRFTCDKRRSRSEIVADFARVFAATGDDIDFDSFGYPTEADEAWTEEREADTECSARAVKMMQWLATRPEKEIALVTHSSWLKHLFRNFGGTTAEKDKQSLHRLAGNAEIRTVCLAMHRGFYPEGEWVDDNTFVPAHESFRRYRYAPSIEAIAGMHKNL